jgi:hypothetical protein
VATVVGFIVGSLVENNPFVGVAVGSKVGCSDGSLVGRKVVGSLVGLLVVANPVVGTAVGSGVGCTVCRLVGTCVVDGRTTVGPGVGVEDEVVGNRDAGMSTSVVVGVSFVLGISGSGSLVFEVK